MGSMKGSRVIRFERKGPVGIVFLSRPEARNAINRELEQALYDALESLDSDPAIRVGVLAADGDVFCAGADLKEVSAKGNPRGPDAPKRESIVSRTHVKPLIAAVDGSAFGGGMELVLACDLIVASRRAKFALSEVRWGLLPSGGGMFRLPRRMPSQVALQMLLTGRTISAERGYALGLVNELADDGNALDIALDIADAIAANGPLAVQLTMQMVRESAYMDERDAWALSRELVTRNFASEDAKEGPRAFAEKRAPQWTGR